MEKNDLERLKKLGKTTKKIREEILNIDWENKEAIEIILLVEKRVKENGFVCAFPCTICINEVAAHFTIFDEKIILKEKDLVKIDFGLMDEIGLISDNAFTIEIKSNEFSKMIEINKKVLKRQLENLSLEKSFGKFGEEIKSFVNENGFQVIENLSGHEISKFELHSGKHIPNYNNNDLDKFEEGKIYAIEPFITQGDNKIKEKGNSNILILENKIKNTRDIIAKKILNVIREKFSKMPFSKRWLLEFFEKRKVLYALEILKKEGIVFEYGKLVSNNEKPISQFEQSVVFFNSEKIVFTDLD